MGSNCSTHIIGSLSLEHGLDSETVKTMLRCILLKLILYYTKFKSINSKVYFILILFLRSEE